MEYKKDDIVTLTKDINSMGKGLRLYGKKGEQCKIISVMGNILIVEGKKERFPVNKIYVQ